MAQGKRNYGSGLVTRDLAEDVGSVNFDFLEGEGGRVVSLFNISNVTARRLAD